MMVENSIDQICSSVRFLELKLTRAKIFVNIYNNLHKDNPVDEYTAVHKISEPCYGCPHVLSIDDNEHYCIK